VSTFISRRIVNPILKIRNGVERIQAGDLDAKIEVKSKDEIGIVARAINEMVKTLKEDVVRMKKLEQVRTQFLGNVSHELRTPLFSIQGYLETLQNGAVDDPSVNRSFLEKAQSNVERLNTLLEDLINISQIESGEMKMSFRFFRINDFLESVVQELVPKASAKQISIQLNTETSRDDEVFGDRERLRQVLNNLLTNAVHYNKPNGTVILSSKKLGDRVHFEVQDTGVGISPEHLPRIFERFYRVDDDRSRSMGGTGLGLAIVKHIVEAHNSTMLVESRVGEGSVFRFTLKGS
jgi:two-component system phosphate regulon sensor histidine kinase PhoR